MAWTFCSGSDAISKAGANVNSDIIASGSTLLAWSNEAEATICNTARSDVVANFGSLTANGKAVMQNLCSAMVAQKIIGYEPEAIGTRGATLRWNMIDSDIRAGLKIIKEGKNKEYLGIT